jgi:diadenosine tetraphosphate (Ap4A) HIT family hydrolase
MDDVCRTASAIQKAFGAVKINYGAYSDKLAHLHFHLVPKYPDGFEYGGIFEMNPQKTYPGEDEYQSMIELIKSHLV